MTPSLFSAALAALIAFLPGASFASNACVAQNNLSEDSFEIAAAGVRSCLEGKIDCVSAENKLRVRGLDVPVESLTFVFKDLGASTKSLVGFGSPDLRGSEAGVILRVKRLPRDITMPQALAFLYGSPAAQALPCEWATDEAPLGQYLAGTVTSATCAKSGRCVVRLRADSGHSYAIVAGAETEFAERYLDQGSLGWLKGSAVRFHRSGLQVIRGKYALKRLHAAPGEAYRLTHLISFSVLP
jgi:hypothetical protein